MNIKHIYQEVDSMKEFFTVVTRKGQITIPAEIRRTLGFKVGDKVALLLEKSNVRLIHTGSVVERTAGLLKGDEPPLSAKELRRIGEKTIAEAAVERSGA